jgi:hypothetical protein
VNEKLMNLIAPPAAHLQSLKLEMEVFLREQQEFRPLTEAEWNVVVIHGATIRVRNPRSKAGAVELGAPNGETFTVRDLAAAIEETERRSRATVDWFGGIDVHHRFFEGIHLDDDGVWVTHWGS